MFAAKIADIFEYHHPEYMPASAPGYGGFESGQQEWGKDSVVYSLGDRQVVESSNDDGDVELKMPVWLVCRQHADRGSVVLTKYVDLGFW